jgi:hypothetical protein
MAVLQGQQIQMQKVDLAQVDRARRFFTVQHWVSVDIMAL